MYFALLLLLFQACGLKQSCWTLFFRRLPFRIEAAYFHVRAQSGTEKYILRVCYKFCPNAIFSLLCRHMPLNWGVKLGTVPEDQLSILQASALNSAMIKAGLFYWLKRRERKPRTFLLFSLCCSICKKVVEKASLDHVVAIRVERVSPVALRDFGHALLPHLISWESICACSSRERQPGAKLSYLFRDGFIFHGWPRRCLMELLTAHHTSCPWVSVSAESRDEARATWLRWLQTARGRIHHTALQ